MQIFCRRNESTTVSCWKYKTFDISHKSTSCPHDFLLRFQCNSYKSYNANSFIHSQSLSHKGNQMCFPPFPSFPWKQLGFIELALKAWMVETTHSISLLNLSKGFPSAESVSQNEPYFCAPQKNVWWNWDTNMKTARHPLWNRSRFRETAGAVKNKRAPDVRLAESGHQNQTRRLAQRFCWLEPVVPPPLPPYSSSHSTPHSSSHLPLSSPFSLFALFFPCYSFLFHSFCFLSSPPVTLPSIPPLSPWDSLTLSF